MASKKRLIDAYDTVIKLAKANRTGRIQYDDVLAVIADQPTVDAVEVVHAQWELCQDDGCEWYECSACRAQPLNDNAERPAHSDYCPNCGAKMDGGNADGLCKED